MNWRLVGILISILPMVLIFSFAPISLNDFFSVGLIPFVISSVFVMAKVLLQAYRFQYFIVKFLGYPVNTTWNTIVARLGGEFITQTTPSYVGGEILRIAWLTKHGVSPGKAAWIATMEIIADVLVGTILGIIAGLIALLNGAVIIGIIIILVSIASFSFWTILLAFSSKKIFQLPNFVTNILLRFVSQERTIKFINYTNTALKDLCIMSRENLNSKQTIKILSIGIGITFLAFLLFAFSFFILSDALNLKINLFDSLLGTNASTQLGSLPITLGGTGLAELGLWAYVSNLSSFPSLNDFLTSPYITIILIWRISSYHVPLIFMWISFMRITIQKKIS